MSDSTADFSKSYSKENLIQIQHVGVTAKIQQQPLKMLLSHNYSSTGTDGGNGERNQYSHDLNQSRNSTTKYNKFSNENCTDCTDDKDIYLEEGPSDQDMSCVGNCVVSGETDTTITTDNSPTLLYRMTTIGCVADKKYGGHKTMDCDEAMAGNRKRNCNKMTPSKIEFQLCDKHYALKRSQKSKKRKVKRRLFVDNLSAMNRCHKRCHGHIRKRNKSLMYRLRRPFVNFYVKCNKSRLEAYKPSCDPKSQPTQSQPITIDHLLNGDYPDLDLNNGKQPPKQQSQLPNQPPQPPPQQQQQQPRYNTNNPIFNYNFGSGIYPFDHGCPEYLKTYDLPPQVFSSVINEQTVHYTTRFWAEFFGSIHIGVSFVITFILQAYRFVLFSLINTLLVGVLHMTSDYFIKPILTVIFNGFVQPPLLFGYNVLASIRDLLAPIADILDNFMKPIATVGNSFRLVHIHYDKRSIMKGV